MSLNCLRKGSFPFVLSTLDQRYVHIIYEYSSVIHLLPSGLKKHLFCFEIIE